METTEYKRCRHGHLRSSDNVDKWGACKQCQIIRQKSKEYKKLQKQYSDKYSQKMTDNYVANRLHIPVALATPELIEMKRQRLLEIRALRELKNTLKG